jgi:hypothetical protein
MSFDLQLFARTGVENAYAADSSGVNPEDYHQIILNTTPRSTVLFSDLGEGDDIKNIEYSWAVESLEAPVYNAVAEGANVTVDGHALPTRIKNYTQLMDKGYMITTTEQAVATKSGTGTDIKKRMLDAGLGMRRNTNKSLYENATAAKHAEGVAGKFGGLPYWFDASNAQLANTQIVDGNSKAISEAMIVSGMQKVYDIHEFDMLTGYCSSYTKLKIDNFTGGAVVNKNKSEKEAGNIIDVYRTSCGTITIKIDRQAPSTDFYALDTRYWKKGFLQNFENKTKSGDAGNQPAHKIEKYVTWEVGLFAKNPLAGFRIKSLV